MDEKSKLLGNFWEICEIFWWKFNRLIEFLTIFGKLLLKLEPSEITSFFYSNIFHFGGVPVFLLAASSAQQNNLSYSAERRRYNDGAYSADWILYLINARFLNKKLLNKNYLVWIFSLKPGVDIIIPRSDCCQTDY